MTRKNWFSSWWENNLGKISFGWVHPDQVRAAVYLTSKEDVRHRLYMDIDAPRASKTSLEAPGGINIKCGQDKSRPDVTFNIQVENGKLALTCQTGDVEILGKNVTIEAKGDGTNDGAITLKSNSKIALNSPKVEINPKQKFEINSEQKIGFKTNGTLELYGSQVICESASSRYGQRGPSQGKPIAPTGDE